MAEMLTVGIPKEIMAKEKRVALTPEAVGALCREGIRVLVEKGAGEGSGYSDPSYAAAGAEIVSSHEEVFERAEFIQKVKEPQEAEFPLLRKEHLVFCYLHLASPVHGKLVERLLSTGLTAIGYETVSVEGRLPLLKPMSEIAGALAAIYAAFFRSQKLTHGREVHYPPGFFSNLELLAARYPLWPDDKEIGKVVIFGGGTAGQKAMEYALKMHGEVTLIEQDVTRLKELQRKWEGEKVCFLPPSRVSKEILQSADVWFGCTHRRGDRADHVLSLEMLKKMSVHRKRLLIDVAIDQGGNFPESRPTTYEAPLFVDSFGNLRFCVTNIPSWGVPYATHQISRLSLPYTKALAKDFDAALRQFPELERGINIQAGEIKLDAIRKVHHK